MIAISIIVPVYNTEKYLFKCINSLINQTLNNIEIICINDGSTDNSLSILNNFSKNDHRIRVVSTQNKGVASARNSGIRRAKGEFIGFCDSDDYVDFGYFENLYNQSSNQDVIRGIRLVDDKKCKNMYGCLVPSIIRREFLLNNKLLFPNKKVGEDSTLKRWIYNKTDKILETEDIGIYYHYERRKGSLSNYNLD